MSSIEALLRNNLKYNQKDYQNKYNKEFMTGFNHGPLTRGPIDESITNQFINKLNDKAASKVITFEATRIEKTLDGGSCSAISLRVAKAALDIMPQCSHIESFSEKMKEVIASIHKISVSEKKKDSLARKEIRSIQAAFNTISVVLDKEKTYDFSQEKIKALASHYELKVISSTNIMEIKLNKESYETFTQNLINLTRGVYLLRNIKPLENHKLEDYGHSTVYIKFSEGEELYFDPQLGLYNINNIQTREILFESLCSAQKQFGIGTCKFHHLEKEG